MEKHLPSNLFSADRPIRSRKEDLLGRAGFADSLASAIKGWTGNDSLVIALYGPWGSGKSSIKYMVLEALREAQNDSPIIVEFNPWQWAGQEQLAHAFFQEVGLQFGRADKSKEGKARAAKWRAYAAYLRVGSFLVGGARNTILGLLGVIAVLGIGGSVVEAAWLQSVFVFVGVLALLLAGFFRWGGNVAESLAAVFSSAAEAREQGLAEIKSELAALLQKLKRPVLVVIDDVDRLSSHEIKLLFQLVKANADFPNLVYLLLFQRDIVEDSLGHIAPGTGRDFLEKIVQVGIDIPHLEQTRLQRVLFEGLNQLLSYNEVAQRFNQQQRRWGNVFIPGLSPYFETLRDVYRFLGMLSVQVARFRHRGSFDVNPVDLIALEVLRVFEPEVYHHIPAAKTPLTEVSDRALGAQATAEEATRRVVESILDKAAEPNRPQVREILKQLFPPAEWVFGGSRYGTGFDAEWYRDLRVCHPDVFDRYFYFAIPERDISQADLDIILSLAGDREGLTAKFRALNERELLGVVLNRLEAYKEELDLRVAVPFITALFDVGDELPDESVRLFIGPDMHASRIVYWYLKREEDARKRARILHDAIRATTGLYLPVMNISLEAGKQERQQSPDTSVVAEEDLPNLKSLCVDKIKQAAASGKLATHRQMAFILYRWREWGTPDDTRQWVAGLIKSKQGLLSFLKAFQYRTTSQGISDYVARVQWRMNLKGIEEFNPVDNLEKQVSELHVEELEEDEQRAVQVFRIALRRKREGKAEDSLWDDDEEKV